MDTVMMTQEEAGGELLPGWTEHTSSDGLIYYYNATTGESRWERPVAEPPADTSKRLLPVDEAISKRVRLGSETDEDRGNGTSSGSRASILEIAEISSPNRKRAAFDERKSHLAEALSARDAILDPNVPSLLTEWVTISRSLAELNNDSNYSVASSALQAATSLAEGYAGFGDQATILGKWLDLTMEDPQVSNGGGATAPSSIALSVANARIKELVAAKKHIVRALNSLLIQYENPPKWILQLLEMKEWRSFIIDLAAKNPSSPFLNFCVRYMVETGGHYEEVAQSVTAVTYFSVFSRTLADQLANLVKLSQEQTEATSGTMNRIVQLVENPAAPHVSFYCGQMLFELERSQSLLKTESARFIVSHLRQRIQNLNTKLLHRGGLRVDFPRLAGLLKRVVSGETDACEACPEIYECYHQEADVSGVTPPLWPLFERDFLDRLVGGLFRPVRKLDDNVRAKACWVLASAALAQQGKTTATLVGEEQEKARNALIEALEMSSRICNDPETIKALETRWTQDLQALAEAHPTCSMGILFWARALLSHADFLRSHAFATGFLAICKMASFAAQKHALQRPHAFAVLKRALDTRPPSGEEGGGAYLSDARLAELLESVIDALVDLMGLGLVMPVLDHFVQSAPSMDLSLLRKFMFGVLQTSEAPYSKQFKEKFQGLLESPPGAKAGLGGGVDFQSFKNRFLAGQIKQS